MLWGVDSKRLESEDTLGGGISEGREGKEGLEDSFAPLLSPATADGAFVVRGGSLGISAPALAGKGGSPVGSMGRYRTECVGTKLCSTRCHDP